MGKIVFLNFAAQGHTNPTLPLVRELVTRGEKIIYYSMPEFRERIEAAGAEFREYDADFTRLDKMKYGSIPQLFRLFQTACRLIMETLPRAIEQEAPDCIVHDAFCSWGRLTADYLNIPAVCLNTTFAFNQQTVSGAPNLLALPQFVAGLPLLISGLRHKSNMEKRFRTKKLGLVDSFFKEPLNFVFTSAGFQPHADLFDGSYKFVGPSIEGRWEEPDEVIPADNTLPVVYVSLGTIVNRDRAFFRNCLRAFTGAEVFVVMSVGDYLRLEEFGNAPPNFVIRNRVPQLAVLSRAAVFVTHAGMNSVHEGLAAGVPLVAVPRTEEQALVADQVVKNGAGLRLKKVAPQTIREAVECLLADQASRAACRRLGESFRSAGGSVRAADEILNYIRRRSVR
jgi:MGT family glycosyltransferase